MTDALAAQGYPIARSYMTSAFAALHGFRIGGADPQCDGVALSA